MEDLNPRALAELVRSGLSADGRDRGPVPAGEAIDGLAGLLQAFAEPGFTCLMSGATRETANTYRGLDGLRAAWRDWLETFDELSVVFEDVLEVPVGALLWVLQAGITRHDRVRIENRSAMLMRVRGGRISAVEFHLDPAEAARVAGLGPQSSQA